jgi:lysophospholipase L1-like esterase
MKPSLHRLCALVLLTGFVMLRPVLGAEDELHLRDGLPATAARVAAAKGELRVAYFGGSITAAPDGWRSLTTDYLRRQYPRLEITEISASLPGTGSDLGACRLERDVLVNHPDLIFVEFAVNDAKTPAEQIQRTMEGIVRQTHRVSPHADICFVYTASVHGIADLEAGNFPAAAKAMETVAVHYGIPTIHFGIEVAQRMKAGTLVFKAAADAASAKTTVFSRDGVHPTAAGHRVYAEVMERVWPSLVASHSLQAGARPPPLRSDNWENAGLRLISDCDRTGEWVEVALDDPGLRGATKPLLPPTYRALSAGAALDFTFSGRKCGLLGISAPDSGMFRVTVDDLPPVIDTLFDEASSPSFCRQRAWFFPGNLSDGPHRVRVELLAEPPDKAAIKAKAGQPIADPSLYAANRLTLSGVLIVGPPISSP